MRPVMSVFVISAAILAGLPQVGDPLAAGSRTAGAPALRIRVGRYVDKMKAGWLGQMAGVGWGGPTEFRCQGVIVPEAKMPQWQPSFINQFEQDDLYVEMTFLRTLEVHGLGVSIRQAGIDFANSRYRLWHANRAGRDNLRTGIAPPDSGHPQFNKHADDIDYQIEADFAGLIAPGMPNTAIRLGETFGRLMNYGDGLYGGQFIAGMYAEAFFETDPARIVEAGLRCIPARSQYHQCITDVLGWWRQYPDDWTRTWQFVDEKYRRDPRNRRFSCSEPNSPFDIDAKINGAYVVMGLLYGRGDPDQTIAVAMRCGQDSDCNPSSAAGILFATIGFEDLPERFKAALDPTGRFSHTPYTFPTLIKVCEKLAREAVLDGGGRIELDAQGKECFVIPASKPRPSPLAQSYRPRRASRDRYTPQEMALIVIGPGEDLSEAIGQFTPGWKVANCGYDMDPGLKQELAGRRNVLVTHPLNETTGCVLSRTVELPADRPTSLRLVVGNDPRGDWDLIVRVDGRQLLRKTIGPQTTSFGWTELTVDLSAFTGRAIKLELVNQPTGWSYEAARWAEISFP
jgi:hypothetical protein